MAGNAADPEVLAAANLARRAACWSPSRTRSRPGRWSSRRAANPQLRIVARAHSRGGDRAPDEARRDPVIMGEHEIAKAMLADIETQPGMSSA